MLRSLSLLLGPVQFSSLCPARLERSNRSLSCSLRCMTQLLLVGGFSLTFLTRTQSPAHSPEPSYSLDGERLHQGRKLCRGWSSRMRENRTIPGASEDLFSLVPL